MPTLTVSLPESLKEFIDREVETRGYGNVSEYVRGLLRAAQEREEVAKLEALLIAGLTRGTEAEISPEFWSELRSEAAKILAKQKMQEQKPPEHKPREKARRKP
jgi:antitoxin ParD1/3/4